MRTWYGSILLVALTLGAATALTFPLRPITVHSLSLLFVAAVVITSRIGGAYPGIATALLSVLDFDWFFDSHPYHFDLDLAGLLRAAVFLALSLLVASLENQRRGAMTSLVASNRELQTALQEVKQLRGLLPICMHCKQIRNGESAWTRLEEYIQSHSAAEFTHSLCPDCYRKYYPEIYAANYPEH